MIYEVDWESLEHGAVTKFGVGHVFELALIVGGRDGFTSLHSAL